MVIENPISLSEFDRLYTTDLNKFSANNILDLFYDSEKFTKSMNFLNSVVLFPDENHSMEFSKAFISLPITIKAILVEWLSDIRLRLSAQSIQDFFRLFTYRSSFEDKIKLYRLSLVFLAQLIQRMRIEYYRKDKLFKELLSWKNEVLVDFSLDYNLEQLVIDNPLSVINFQPKVFTGPLDRLDQWLFSLSVKISLENQNPIDTKLFKVVDSLKDIPGKKFLIVAIWWWSDCIQAWMLWMLLKNSGKEVKGVASVGYRYYKDWTPKIYNNHGWEIVPWVLSMTPDTSSGWRFLANVTANDFPSYVALRDSLDKMDSTSMQNLVDKLWVDTVLLIDTWWDSLYSINWEWVDPSEATPDQDVISLKNFYNLSWVNVLSSVISTWIDSPRNAQEVLLSAWAKFYNPSNEEAQAIIFKSRQLNFDGKDISAVRKERFGHTPQIWLHALLGRKWIVASVLPEDYVIKRLWDPFCLINSDSFRWIFFMEAANHYNAIWWN